jgi:hypothetical protein
MLDDTSHRKSHTDQGNRGQESTPYVMISCAGGIGINEAAGGHFMACSQLC